MATILFIAGHGEQRGGGFDPGATGHIKIGEHKYYETMVFPAMKKYVPDGAKVVFFSSHDCYSYADIVAQARKYGSDTVVVECHYDASGNPNAKGGHVIIKQGFKPDAIDLALVQAIKSTVGLWGAYANGISGRSDLQNVNLTARDGVNYRLLELGFCTNKSDAAYMLGQVDKIAKALVLAVCGAVKADEPKAETPKPKPVFERGVAVKLKDTATHWINRYSAVGATGQGRVAITNIEKAQTYTVTYQYGDGTFEVAVLGTDGKSKAGRYKAYERDFVKTEVKQTLHKVQVGAYADRANAERMAKDLTDKGFDTVIVEG